MKVLFDQGTSAPLRHALTGHLVSTAFEMGWAEIENWSTTARRQQLVQLLEAIRKP